MISLFARQQHRVLVSRSPHLAGVEVLRGYHRGLTAAWQFVPMVQLQYIVAGAARIWCDGKRETIWAGDCVINAPNHDPRIEQRLTAEGETLRAFIAPEFFDVHRKGVPQVRAQDLRARVLPRSGLRAPLERLAVAIEKKWPPVKAEAALADLVDGIACEFQSRAGSFAPILQRPEIERARRLLFDRFDQAVTLDDLTVESGLSKFHLVRVFRDIVGATPHAYQVHVRVSRAREMLDAGTSAAEVAMRCGFADQAHFTRCFKRVVGYTPSAFARFRGAS